MKNNINVTLVFVILCMFFTTTAYANSSWHWLTKTIPFNVLPYAVVLTLLIEYITIKKINSINHSFKLFIIICLANLVSFLLPYAVLLMPSDVGYTFDMSINYMPKYIVGFGYLFLTLVAEVPIVYFGLKNIVTNRKKPARFGVLPLLGGFGMEVYISRPSLF